jgi:hypothetical protein
MWEVLRGSVDDAWASGKYVLKRKNPTFAGWGFCLVHEEPDDYLLSHGDPHYHRRGVVSRSCSGWEGVVPTRYGHQA